MAEKPTQEFRKIDFTKTTFESNEDNVVISGKTDDTTAFKYFNLLRFEGLLNLPFIEEDENKILLGDSLHLEVYNIKEPKLLDIVAFSGYEKHMYFTRIFVSPGDSIFLNIKDKEMNFRGENEAHYNFFIEMNDPLRENWAVFNGNFNNYKEETKEAYQHKKQFFEGYVSNNANVSEAFQNKVGAEIKFEYLYNLIMPREKNNKGQIMNNPQGINYLVAENFSSNEQFFDSKDYFDDIQFEEFQRPDLMQNDYFRRSLIAYIRHYFTNQGMLEYSEKNLEVEKEFIQENLSGEMETYAMGRLIIDYYNKGFGRGENEVEVLRNLIYEYENNFNTESYAVRMNQILDDLTHINFEIPSLVLEDKLLSISGDTITFAEVLQKQGDNIKVVDIWASWCTPSIYEFKAERNLQQEPGRELKMLYFSVDRSKDAWLDKLIELRKFIDQDEHFLVLDPEDSGILKHLLLKDKGNGETYFSIPRYSILNSDNVLMNNNAPRPSDTTAFRKVINQIETTLK